VKQAIRVYDVFDTLVTDNTYELLEQENFELCRKARENYTAVRAQVIPYEEKYRAQGLVKTKLLPRVRLALENARSKGFALGVFSSGTPDGIKRMLAEGGIDDLIDEQISVDAIGKKDEPGTYRNLQLVLRTKGLELASYADDKAAFCKAAANAFWMPGETLTVPRIYHVSANEPVPEHCSRVASIADIG
jgi:FMN phosphatase YigB (HAD superfamily)